jgi:tRNA(Leu) C34 or U34 (ribose-2'-O)-methylase TrmL
MNTENTCRLCTNYGGDKFKYGPRHYAHAECAMNKWGAAFFQKLHLWQLNKFPALIAKKHGAFIALERAIETHAERETKTEIYIAGTQGPVEIEVTSWK